jgi:hypothetical protein
LYVLARRYNGSMLPRVALAACTAALLYFAAAQSGEGFLRVEILDSATGGHIPAMVCITSLADGKWRVPPDGSVAPGYTRVPDFYEGRPWRPGDIGPVRLTAGDYKDNQTRSSIYGTASAYPFWKEVAAYFVSRPFSIKLPAGRWRLAIERGLEYLPVFEEFEVRPGQQLGRTVRLKRWVDMARGGWYSGDDHVHYPRTKPEHDQFLLTWARAEDVHVLNIVQQRTLRELTFKQAFGNQRRYQEEDFALVSGQEDPSMQIDEQGHTLALNLSEPVSDMPRFHLYDVMFDGARSRGGVTGYAHIAWAPEWYRRSRPQLFPTWDSTLNVIAGRVDFFEILQFRMLGLEDYYDFLSLGARLTASAGSDVPWGSTIGEVRTYAYTGKSFSVDRWFEAVRKGNTFVTNGPMVSLAVDGAKPGEEVKVPPGRAVRISARSWAPKEIGAPRTMEIIALGRTLRKVQSRGPEQTELKVEMTVRAEESQWIAVRVESQNGGLAHTSPVYVIAGGRPILDRARAPELVKKRLAVLDHVEKLLQDSRYLSSYAPGEAEAHRERVRMARDKYEALLR